MDKRKQTLSDATAYVLAAAKLIQIVNELGAEEWPQKQQILYSAGLLLDEAEKDLK